MLVYCFPSLTLSVVILLFIHASVFSYYPYLAVVVLSVLATILTVLPSTLPLELRLIRM